MTNVDYVYKIQKARDLNIIATYIRAFATSIIHGMSSAYSDKSCIEIIKDYEIKAQTIQRCNDMEDEIGNELSKKQKLKHAKVLLKEWGFL